MASDEATSSKRTRPRVRQLDKEEYQHSRSRSRVTEEQFQGNATQLRENGHSSWSEQLSEQSGYSTLDGQESQQAGYGDLSAQKSQQSLRQESVLYSGHSGFKTCGYDGTKPKNQNSRQYSGQWSNDPGQEGVESSASHNMDRRSEQDSWTECKQSGARPKQTGLGSSDSSLYFSMDSNGQENDTNSEQYHQTGLNNSERIFYLSMHRSGQGSDVMSGQDHRQQSRTRSEELVQGRQSPEELNSVYFSACSSVKQDSKTKNCDITNDKAIGSLSDEELAWELQKEELCQSGNNFQDSPLLEVFPGTRPKRQASWHPTFAKNSDELWAMSLPPPNLNSETKSAPATFASEPWELLDTHNSVLVKGAENGGKEEKTAIELPTDSPSQPIVSSSCSPPLQCPDCKSMNVSKVKNIDLPIYQCTNCGRCIGQDDTMLPCVLKEKLGQGQVKALCELCDNDDPNEYIIHADENGDLKYRCTQCGDLKGFEDDVERNIDESCGTLKVVEDGYDKREEENEDCDEEWTHLDDKGIDELCWSMICECGQGKGDIEKVREGNILTLVCKDCNNSKTFHFPEVMPTPKPKPKWLFQRKKSVSQKPQKCSVRLRDIQIGDHLCWDRPNGYSHHAIVIKGPHNDAEFEVCHYSSESSSGSGQVIKTETLDLRTQQGELYRMEYQECLTNPSEVAKRATSRLNEKDYNLFFNNCETFAKWCKTGQEVSGQVSSAGARLKSGLNSLKSMLRFGIGSKPSNVSTKASALTPASIAISIAMVTAGKAVQASRNVAGYNQQKKDGQLSKTAFLKVVIREVIQSTGACAGAVVGAVLGTLYIPVVGTVVGATLGGLIGEGLGCLIGSQVANAVKSRGQKANEDQ